MKTRAKLLATCALVLALITSQAALAAAYQDISDVDEATRAGILTLADAGIMKGYANGTEFRPWQPVPRAQVAKVIAQAMGWEPNPSAAEAFVDVTDDTDKGYIGALVEHGVTTGVTPNTFEPYRLVTREQLATFFIRALELEDDAVHLQLDLPFGDSHRISEAHRANVALAAKIGFLQGKPDGTFDPQGTAVRAHLAKFGNQLYSKRADFILKAVQLDPERLVQVHFIDVGQGDATYISLPGNVDILIDAGSPEYGDEVAAYLQELGVDDIEYLIATLPAAEHIGGMLEVLQAFEVENVYMPKVTQSSEVYESFVKAVQNKGLQIQEARAGVDVLSIATCMAIGCPPSIHLSFVGPVKEYADMRDGSAVVRLDYGSTSLLIAGDATSKSEADMMASEQFLKAQLLRVGNHGAATSTSQEFLDQVSPEYAMISVGKGADELPAAEVLERLSKAGATVYRTDQSGTVVALTNGHSLILETAAP